MKQKSTKKQKPQIQVNAFVRHGYRIRGNIQAQATLLAQLGMKGGVKVKDVVRLAKNPKCPFHPNFTWDVAAAAKKQWHNEALYLIQAIGYEVINVQTHKVISRSRTTVSLVYDTTAKDPHCSPRVLVCTEATLNNPAQRYSILNLALAELKAFITKYATLSEMAGVISAARKTVKRLAKRM